MGMTRQELWAEALDMAETTSETVAALIEVAHAGDNDPELIAHLVSLQGYLLMLLVFLRRTP